MFVLLPLIGDDPQTLRSAADYFAPTDPAAAEQLRRMADELKSLLLLRYVWITQTALPQLKTSQTTVPLPPSVWVVPDDPGATLTIADIATLQDEAATLAAITALR